MSSMEYRRYSDFSKFPTSMIEKATFQRDINKKHVAQIVKYIQSCDYEPILGCIELAHYNDKIFIVDGQHRLCALKICYKEFDMSIAIHTFNYTVSSSEEMKSIFMLRNKNLDVADYIRKGDNVSLREMGSYLEERWPGIFKTGRCVRPSVNIDNFLEKLRETDAIKMNLGQFKDYIEKINIHCKEIVENMDDDELRKCKISEDMLRKFEKCDCYLGYNTKFRYLA